jgi:hypothetical protein
MPLTAQDINEFRLYLANCTDAQIRGVYDKECTAAVYDSERLIYAELTVAEAERRGIFLPL